MSSMLSAIGANHKDTRTHYEEIPPESPQLAPLVGLHNGPVKTSVELREAVNGLINGAPDQLSNGFTAHGGYPLSMQLQLQGGSVYRGVSFGAEKSIAGELVFQTGMVGYPESITDPSYRGQILVITFPLVGNYGVPSRQTVHQLLNGLPAHFEASQIYLSGLIVASYSGEDYSHHLAQCSLGTWLKEQNIPAMYGVDTRALTKNIREKGSMLGRLLIQKNPSSNATPRGAEPLPLGESEPMFEHVDWVDPNIRNLVADGETVPLVDSPHG